MKKLYIIGDISWDAYKSFSQEIDAIKRTDKVTIELASDGGDAHAALAFYSKIRRHKGEVTIIGTGNIASAAVLVLAAGDRRYMTSEAWVMVHEDQAELTGSVSELERETFQARRLENQWNSLIAKSSAVSADEWERMHKATTYLSATQCKDLDLVHGII
jgi:ATP-dependent protease ClpP protease subunit